MDRMNRHRIIVGVDYGTTFTGISYVSTDKHDINDIVVINSWPGPSRDTETVFKAPSRIAYASENQSIKFDKWGFQVEPGMTAYSWTKLLLDKHTPRTKYDDATLESKSGMGMLKLPLGKDAISVCADFLHPIYCHLLQVLEKQITKETLAITPLEFWFTMPAIWSDEAQSATREAAKRAGFGSRLSDSIYMITEPEAAGIATLKRSIMDVSNTLVKPGDGVLICDCGGGTVDITTYEIKHTHPKLEFNEICTGVGGKCGSTAIDRNFYMLLSKRFGNAFDSLPLRKRGPGSNLMKAFEQVKRDFGYSEDGHTHELPLNMSIDKPNPEHFDDDERLVLLTNEDIRSMFNPVVDQILELVGRQINDANKESKRWVVNKIILVGGFGDSEYLRKCFENSFSKIEKVQVIVPEQPQAAIVKGAALRGLEGIRPNIKRCRRHYGFAWSIPFRPGIDSEVNAYYDIYNGKKMVDGIMNWMIHKGEEVFDDTWRTCHVGRAHTTSCPLKQTMTLYSCSLDDAPERVDHSRVDVVGNVATDFSDIDLNVFESRHDQQHGPLRKLNFQVKVIFGTKDSILTFRSESKGEVMGTTGIKFANR